MYNIHRFIHRFEPWNHLEMRWIRNQADCWWFAFLNTFNFQNRIFWDCARYLTIGIQEIDRFQERKPFSETQLEYDFMLASFFSKRCTHVFRYFGTDQQKNLVLLADATVLFLIIQHLYSNSFLRSIASILNAKIQFIITNLMSNAHLHVIIEKKNPKISEEICRDVKISLSTSLIKLFDYVVFTFDIVTRLKDMK